MMSGDNIALRDTETPREDSTRNEERMEPVTTIDIDNRSILNAGVVVNEIRDRKLEGASVYPVETLKCFEIPLNSLETNIYDQLAVHYEKVGLQNIDTHVNKLIIHQIYNETIQEAVQTYQKQHGLANSAYKETVDALKTRSTALLSRSTDVHQKVVDFHSKIHTQLEPDVKSATSPQLLKRLNETKALILHGEGSPYHQLNPDAQNALRKWFSNYPNKLDFLIEFENINYEHQKKIIFCEAGDIYHETMRTITNQHYLSPKQLSTFHFYLLGSFTELIKRVLMTEEEYQDGNPNELVSNLIAKLNSDYEQYKHENRAKLTQLQKAVDELITQQKKEYCGEIEDALKRQDKADLLAAHLEIAEQVKQNLKFEIASKIHVNEPCQNYIVSLEISIEKYWSIFEQTYKSQERNNADSSQQLCPGTPSLFRYCSTENPSHEWTAHPIPFIVFHLSLSTVSVSIPEGNDVKLLCNQPLTVRQTMDGKLDICADSDPVTTHSEKTFKIGELITGNVDLHRAQIVTVNNNPIEISVELLLGFIFDNLKRQVESLYKALVKSCVIIIPFWLTSYQRQQIIDGGKIAQFKKTRLINENLAIAMHAYVTRKQLNSDDEIFVLSENSERVNATIYSVGDSMNDLRVSGHCGDYEITKGLTPQEKISKACTEAQFQSKSGVRMINNLVKNRSLQDNTSLKLLFLSYETSNWKQNLQIATTQISNATLVYKCGWKGAAAEKGAILLASNFKSFNKTMRDPVSSNIRYSLHPPANPRTDYEYFGTKEYMELFSQDLGGTVSRTLPDSAREVWLYQESKYNGNLHGIGKLVINGCVPKVQLDMVIDFQLVAKFLMVNGDKESTTFNWTPCNISEHQINQIISVMNSKNHNNASKAISKAEEQQSLNEELKINFKNVHGRISNGEGTFRTQVGRDMALKQITESLNVLDSVVSAKITESQRMIYDRITKTYFPILNS